MKWRKHVWTVIIVLILSSGTILSYLDIDLNGSSADWNLEHENKTPPLVFPLSGASFSTRDIVKSSDPSLYDDMAYVGKELRSVYDYRVNDWIDIEAFLFKAYFKNSPDLEIRVNVEIESRDSARALAEIYAHLAGQLPNALRTSLKTLTIHQGDENFGGGNGDILIYTESGKDYMSTGHLEEIFIHEGAHISLDPMHRNSTNWKNAQKADSLFISTYAKENPNREDLAESFILYQGIRYAPDRLSADFKDSVLQRIPNRIAFFDSLALDMYPVVNFE